MTLSNFLCNYKSIPELGLIMLLLMSPYLVTVAVKSSFILGVEFMIGMQLSWWYYQHIEHLFTTMLS